MKPKSFYFGNLDVMRFVAAYLVLCSHVPLTLGLLGLQNTWFDPWGMLAASGAVNLWEAFQSDRWELVVALVHEMGSMAVVFFFVLSGFLISLLLIRESEVTGRIHVSRFYLRRVLRIWPLYFTVITIGLYVLPQFSLFHIPAQAKVLSSKWMFLDLPYFLILPNLSHGLVVDGFPPNIGQVWSIGVEEQFYLFWPWLFLLTKAKPKWLMMFILSVIGLKASAIIFEWPQWMKVFLATMKFESMAIGGIGAHVYHNCALNSISNSGWRLIGVLSLVCVVVTFFFCPLQLQDGLFLVQSCFFLLLIFSGVMLPDFAPRFIQATLVWLGQRSYGIYMWHMMMITLVANLLSVWLKVSDLLFEATIVFASAGTFLLSSWSYRLLEKPFLNLKNRF